MSLFPRDHHYQCKAVIKSNAQCTWTGTKDVNTVQPAELDAPSALCANFHHGEDIQMEKVNDQTPAVLLSTVVYHNDNEKATDQSIVDQLSERNVLNCRRFYGGYVQRQLSSVKRMRCVNVTVNCDSPPRPKRKSKRPIRFD